MKKRTKFITKIDHANNRVGNTKATKRVRVDYNDLPGLVYDLYYNTPINLVARHRAALEKKYGKAKVAAEYEKTKQKPRPKGSGLFD